MSDAAAPETDRLRVKICGLRDPVSIAAAADAGADYLGFVFHAASPRAVTPEQAATLLDGVPPGPARVGLFVDPDPAAIAATLACVPLDILQIHATPAEAASLRRRFGLPVWRALGVGSADDLPGAAEPVDALLLDARPPAGVALPGGNGAAFDWDLLAGWAAPMPWVLAGGLTADRLAEAVHRSGARIVDVSSGVERARGVKDPALIRRFLDVARHVAIAPAADPIAV